MKVIEINQPTTTREKMHILQELRKDIGEKAFRRALAALWTKHLVELIEWKGKTMNRRELMDRVNITVESFGCKPMSYSYFRDWV